LIPTVGRIVHYYVYTDGEPMAAIIVRCKQRDFVAEGPIESHYDVYLTGFPDKAGFPDERAKALRSGNPVPYSRWPEKGHWSWPVRV
jgi:hypothetical protein